MTIGIRIILGRTKVYGLQFNGYSKVTIVAIVAIVAIGTIGISGRCFSKHLFYFVLQILLDIVESRALVVPL